MTVVVELHDYFEGFSFEYRSQLRVPWNVRKTKLDGKLELVDNPGLNRTKINNFKIAVRFYDLSHVIDFGVINGKQTQEYVVECYAELQATNVITSEVQTLDRWPSNLGEDYQDSGNQYPVEAGLRGVAAPRPKRKPAKKKPAVTPRPIPRKVPVPKRQKKKS